MVTAIGFLFSVLAQLIASTSLQASLIDTTVFVLHVLLWTQIGAQVALPHHAPRSLCEPRS